MELFTGLIHSIPYQINNYWYNLLDLISNFINELELLPSMLLFSESVSDQTKLAEPR